MDSDLNPTGDEMARDDGVLIDTSAVDSTASLTSNPHVDVPSPDNVPPAKSTTMKRRAEARSSTSEKQKKQKTAKMSSGPSEGQPRGRAKKLHDNQTALEIASITEELEKHGKDTARELGIFLCGEQVSLKLAGLDVPEEDATTEQKTRFNAAVAAAIMKTKTTALREEWWVWTATQAEKWLGFRELDEDEGDIDIHELMAGTRRRDLSADEELEMDSGEEQEEHLTKKKRRDEGRPHVAEAYLREVNLLGNKRKSAPRGSKSTVDALITHGLDLVEQKPKRKSQDEQYPEVPPGDPAYEIRVSKKQLEEFLLQYPTDKHSRHRELPYYFSRRGDLYLKHKDSKEIVQEWITQAEAAAQSTDPWPKNLLTRDQMRNILAYYDTTIASYSSNGLLTSRGKARKAFQKSEPARDPLSQKFVRTEDGVVPLNDIGTREAAAMVLQGNMKSKNRKTQERMDSSRNALNKGTLDLVEGMIAEDKKKKAFLAAVNNLMDKAQSTGVATFEEQVKQLQDSYDTKALEASALQADLEEQVRQLQDRYDTKAFDASALQAELDQVKSEKAEADKALALLYRQLHPEVSLSDEQFTRLSLARDDDFSPTNPYPAFKAWLQSIISPSEDTQQLLPIDPALLQNQQTTVQDTESPMENTAAEDTAAQLEEMTAKVAALEAKLATFTHADKQDSDPKLDLIDTIIEKYKLVYKFSKCRRDEIQIPEDVLAKAKDEKQLISIKNKYITWYRDECFRNALVKNLSNDEIEILRATKSTRFLRKDTIKVSNPESAGEAQDNGASTKSN